VNWEIEGKGYRCGKGTVLPVGICGWKWKSGEEEGTELFLEDAMDKVEGNVQGQRDL